MQGPKIRVASFNGGKAELCKGQNFILDSSQVDVLGNSNIVGFDYSGLTKDVQKGSVLIIGDGELSLQVTDVVDTKIFCEVMVSGIISDHKGINLQGGGLTADVITAKDSADIVTAISLDCDFIALSFVSSPKDINDAKAIIKKHGDAKIIAKIERHEAIKNIDGIISASDGIMVARGDLALEIGNEEVPAVQKMLLKKARYQAKPVIIATHMMESMISSPSPTRAEVSDVANAILDGTDAVMLSAETAVGKYPHEVLKTVNKICLSTEKHVSEEYSFQPLCNYKSIDYVIAMSTMYAASSLKIKAIIALTESGRTPLWMSRIKTRSTIPIYALSRHVKSRRIMMLYKNVYPLQFDITNIYDGDINYEATKVLENLNLVTTGDFVILTKGDHIGVEGGVNAMKIMRVGAIKHSKEKVVG